MFSVLVFIAAFSAFAMADTQGPPPIHTVKSRNFTVHAPNAEIAIEISDKAEALRAEFSKQWFGSAFSRWYYPCPIHVTLDPKETSGLTTYTFDRGEVGSWNMTIQGTRQVLLDSVLPHEVTHAVMASFYRRPIPRWADEGFASRVEGQSERAKLYGSLLEIMKTNRGIAFGSLLAMIEYPKDKIPLYAQGFTLTTMLIEARDEWHFLNFLTDGMTSGDWSASVNKFYGYSNFVEMEAAWRERVKSGNF